MSAAKTRSDSLDHARYVTLDALNLADGTSDPGDDGLDWKLVLNGDSSAQPVSMAAFNRWLRDAGIADLDAVDVPGGYLLMPWGVRLAERFAELVRGVAADQRFDEVAYPQVVPIAAFHPVADLIDIEAGLVTLTYGERAVNLALTPTGEQQIYSHWARSLRRPEDFPIRIVQRARYFRPISAHRRTGGGVFKGLEAVDVFELHASFLTAAEAETCALDLQRALSELLVRLGVPATWSARPPWTNNGSLYHWAIGCDVPLPNCATVQVAGSYFQGQVFSARYDIGIGARNERRHAWQMDGFITRRALWAALFRVAAGITCLHPELTPVEAVMLATGMTADQHRGLLDQVAQAHATGLRVHLEVVDRRTDLRQIKVTWLRRRVPLVVLVFGTASGGFERVRCVLIRGDDRAEAVVFGLERFATTLASAVDTVGRRVTAAAKRDLAGALRQTDDRAVARAIIGAGGIAVVPLIGNRDAVVALERIEGAEVLGLVEAPDKPAICVVSGQPTRLRALVARRL